MKLPKARTENLLEQNLEKETLLYDLLIDKAFNLNESLTIVYKACGQNSTFDEIKQKHKFTDDFVYLALDELKRSNLLADVNSYQSLFESTNRREVIKKVGLATMFALPVITGLVAPKSANAASNSESGGTTLYGACAPSGTRGVCYGELNCVGGVCCQRQPTGKATYLSGVSAPLPKICSPGFTEAGTVFSCDDFAASEYCCSARASGSCVAQDADEYLDGTIDGQDVQIPVCYGDDGSTTIYSRNVVCSCICE